MGMAFGERFYEVVHTGALWMKNEQPLTEREERRRSKDWILLTDMHFSQRG
jgi:hypothetical protein